MKRPPDRIDELIALFKKLKAQTKGTKGMRAQRHNMAQLSPDQTGGEVPYTPLAAADQYKQRVLLNPQSPNAMDPRLEPDPQRRAASATYQRGGVAHEMGHLFEPRLMNRAKADTYQDVAMGYRGRPWLTATTQGRAENRIQGQARTPWGLPSEGFAGIHTAPNEQYANDVGFALGHGFGRTNVRDTANMTQYETSHASKRKIAKLRALGIVPTKKGKR